MEKIFINDLIQIVLENRRRNYKSLNTYIWEGKISKKILDYFTDIDIRDVSKQSLLDFFEDVRYKSNGELYSEKYLKSLKSILSATFEYALEEDLVLRNPIGSNFKLPYCKKYNPKNRIVTEETLKELFSVLHQNDRLKIIIPFILFTGMRIGEVCALKWSNIDFKNQVISISGATSRKSYIYKKEVVVAEYHISDTKTDNSTREIPLTPQILMLLNSWKSLIDENIKWKKLILENNNKDIIFPNYNGKIMNYNTLYKSLKRFLEKHGITDVRFHKLRHNYATDMLVANVDVAIISQLLGHKQISTTCNIYIKEDIRPKMMASQKHMDYLKDKKLFF